MELLLQLLHKLTFLTGFDGDAFNRHVYNAIA
jgi:hypothetical protein